MGARDAQYGDLFVRYWTVPAGDLSPAMPGFQNLSSLPVAAAPQGLDEHLEHFLGLRHGGS